MGGIALTASENDVSMLLDASFSLSLVRFRATITYWQVSMVCLTVAALQKSVALLYYLRSIITLWSFTLPSTFQKLWDPLEEYYFAKINWRLGKQNSNISVFPIVGHCRVIGKHHHYTYLCSCICPPCHLTLHLIPISLFIFISVIPISTSIGLCLW